jgi:hypothetical protein
MTRNEAVRLIAQQAMKSLSKENRQSIIEEWWGHAEEIPNLGDDVYREAVSEECPSDTGDPRYDRLVLHGLQAQWMLVSNDYLAERLRELGYDGKIDGPDPQLQACACCSYKTLTRRGHYDICPVCFWEDDGGNDPSRYSSPNHMTLEDARRNFVHYGACSPEHVRDVDPEGRRKYHMR